MCNLEVRVAPKEESSNHHHVRLCSVSSMTDRSYASACLFSAAAPPRCVCRLGSLGPLYRGEAATVMSPEPAASAGLQRRNLLSGSWGTFDTQIFVLCCLSFIFFDSLVSDYSFISFISTLTLGIDESQQNNIFH